jgi:hypothetical protein
VNGDVSRFAHIWQFEGKEHILVSGRYNFINGYIEGAILREFARYENLWGSTGDTELPATETSNETNVESSARSSSAANTYENTTVVNIGSGGGGAANLNDLLDVDTTAATVGSILYFNGTEWIDKTLQMVMSELNQLGDFFYKSKDGKSIGTKYSFFSEQDVSANGADKQANVSISDLQAKDSELKEDISRLETLASVNASSVSKLSSRVTDVEGGVTNNATKLAKLLAWFAEDGNGNVFTTRNFYSTKEISANGLSLGNGGESGESGLIQAILGYDSIGAELNNDYTVVFNAYATNEAFKAVNKRIDEIDIVIDGGRADTKYAALPTINGGTAN